MKYFFTRKLMFVKECDAVVCYPGGFGTMDEAMEVLTLVQTGKRDVVPIILADAPGGTYWKMLDEFIRKELLAGGMISPEDLHLYSVTEDFEEAADEIMQFYKNYHSMRYVGRDLVLRIREPLPQESLDIVNRDFADVLNSGQFVQTNKLEEEEDDENTNGLTRLVAHFNRRNHGRLRQLINFINTQM